MDNLETSLAITVYNAPGNTSEAIVEISIKLRASTTFGNLVYSLDRPEPSMAVIIPHEEFFNSEFGVWIDGKHVSDRFCKPSRMHKVWRVLGISQ